LSRRARHARLAVQYGSTLRNLGKLALTLHSAGRKDEALRVAIEAQIDSLPCYQRSTRNYAKRLS
jgi:formylmethanofuran dehydrogenase subunit E